MDDLLRDFLTESSENLAKLDNDLVSLEQHPEETSLLNSIFRTIHTIKGTCGFIGLCRLEGVAHAAENVLDALRSGRLVVQSAVIGDVLAAIDCIKEILEHLEKTEAEPEGDDTALIAQLEQWLESDAAHHTPTSATEMGTSAPSADLMHAEHAEAPVAAVVPATPTAPSPPATPAAKERRPWDGVERRKRPDDDAVSESTLRVGVQVLDQLMNLVGELALSRNQLLQLMGAHEDTEFSKPVQQLNRVTTDLLEAVMKTRMQPIANVWTKLPRIIRDLSQSSGKQISLECYGAETELDRQILQAIQDPLTHMVRNSADHGIERPADRSAAGKSEGGTIKLSARHEGGHVVIELADDGAGIDPQRIKRKAIERGLVRADLAEQMSDTQVLRFIFEPGFSTAEQITNISGRGVGMDVVRSNIEAIGGTVDLTSAIGRGTTIRVKIPLTLAIIQALLVGTAGETFAVPQIGVVELVRITEEQAHLVEMVHGAEFYRLRESLLPLVRLDEQLKLRHERTACDCNIVVCQVGESRFGLVVDEVFDTQEIVVKPVGRLVKHLTAYAGCTITGDGRVIMILDTTGVGTLANIANRVEEAKAAGNATQKLTVVDENPTESVLLFNAGYPALQAVPLSRVARLEEFPRNTLEQADGRVLVQYRGALMPILPSNPAMDIMAMDPRPVIVFSNGEQSLGIAVDEIRDIVEDHITLQRVATRAGVLGVTVIAERATEVVDLDWYFREALGTKRSPSLTPVMGTARIAA
ncbi:chemotaxis protein CheA [Gemmatimonas phototrophica]|uniref:chemotaxis protein CheA n=1 Tax=Gemmatimonas phototrophica TaxID=1379270 RepID=UPI0006A7037D|nr:chemotaxis protein CheA [Gemmatimonas phototrophica]